jgi:LacI family transcriptional regulator
LDLPQCGRFNRVLHDNREIGRLAAEHFLERGFHQLVFVGPKIIPSTHERELGFEEHLREVGHAPEALEYVHDEEIAEFCKGFQKSEVPTGVFCADDRITWQVLAVVRQLGLRLPEDVALMGVGPDELAQAVSPISISSVLMDNKAQAAEIFRLLSEARDGKLGDREEVRVPPTGIFEGESTGYYSPADPLVAKALERIRGENAPRDAAQLARDLNVSRRVLERHFQEAIGRSPARELRRARMALAQRLLRGTDLSIDLISERCGYEHARHFTEMFRKMTGETPAKYRRQMKM